jgi:hypothetical protein
VANRVSSEIELHNWVFLAALTAGGALLLSTLPGCSDGQEEETAPSADESEEAVVSGNRFQCPRGQKTCFLAEKACRTACGMACSKVKAAACVSPCAGRKSLSFDDSVKVSARDDRSEDCLRCGNCKD